MNDNIAVKIDHVSKYFRLPTDSTTSLRTTLVNRFRGVKGSLGLWEEMVQENQRF